MTLADDLSDVKPADNFDSDQIVDKGFLDGQLPPLATFQASSESAKATEDLRNISRGRRVQLGFGESVELTKLRLRSCKKNVKTMVRLGTEPYSYWVIKAVLPLMRRGIFATSFDIVDVGVIEVDSS